MKKTQALGRNTLSIAIAAALLGTAVTAGAAEGGRSGVLEEITVTAERREASIQDVPMSITALSGESLTKAGIQNTQDLVNLTPGLIVQRSVVGKISIRGVGNENYTIAGDPGVAVHTDGIYVARASAGLFDLFDIGRVEVLRGPQGTLYGRNATGGVINIVPTAPSEETSGYLRAELGNYNKRRYEAAVGGALGDSGFTGRVALMGAWRDGYTTNIFPGADTRDLDELDNQDLWAYRAQLAWDGGGIFRARFSTEYLHDNSNLPPYKYINQPAALPNENYLLGKDRTVSQGYETQVPGALRDVGSDEDVFKTFQRGHALHLDWDLGGMTLKSITGYRETEFNWVNDGDGADVFYVNYDQQDDSEQFSQEIQLASDTDGDLSWILGAFYFEEEGDSWIALPFTFGFGLPFYIEIDGGAETEATAVFGEVKYAISDALTVTVGARYTNEDRSTDYVYDINFGNLFRRVVDDDDSFSAATPRLVLDYRVSDDVSLYASATRGFKSGGFNMLAVQPGFKEEKVWNFEAGVKSELADGRVRLNGNVFYMDYTDMQVGQIVNLSSVLTNAGESRIYGAELELAALPVEQLELGATVAYLNTEYEDFCTGDPTKPLAPIDAGCTAADPIQLKGNELPRAPELAVTASATWTIPMADGSDLALRADARYQSDTYFTQFNRPLVSQDSYTVVNARLTWTSANDGFSFGVWANNLFDEDYYTEVLESGAFNPQLVAQGYVAPPRTYGVSTEYRF